jgi:hypothetical protein
VSIGPDALCTKAVPLRRAGPLSPGMSSEQPIHDDADAWRPLQSPEEREALVLEFQRLAARLVQAQLISTTTSSRLVRSMNRERRTTEDRRNKLAQLVLDVLLSLDDGTLKEGEHFARLPDERVAVHPEAVATALYRAERGRLLRRELRALLELGWRHERDVVVARSERVRFDHEGDRRRCAVLHLPSARKFVGGRSKPVPAR